MDGDWLHRVDELRRIPRYKRRRYVLVLVESDISRLIAAFPLEEFDCPPADVIAVEAARQERGHFNLVHHATGFKADFYIARKDRLSR